MNPIIDKIRGLINLQLEKSEETYVESIREYEFLKKLIMTIFIASIFLGIGFSTWIIKTLLISIKKVNSNLTLVEKGNLSGKIEFRVKDEISNIGDKINATVQGNKNPYHRDKY
jgi:methyl-accepting chemotaxis protein